MPGLKETIGKNLLEILRKKGISQTKLAQDVGVSFQTINNYIKGRKGISNKTLTKIADVLGVAETDLTTRSAFGTTQEEMENTYKAIATRASYRATELELQLEVLRRKKAVLTPSQRTLIAITSSFDDDQMRHLILYAEHLRGDPGSKLVSDKPYLRKRGSKAE